MYGFEDLNIIEKVHNDVLRKLIGARKSTPSYIICGVFGRYPLEITVTTRMLSLWNHMLMGKKETNLITNLPIHDS